jgi:hypothetical protein
MNSDINKIVDNVALNAVKRKDILDRAEAAKKMLDPETYVQMAMAEINAEPNAHDPQIFHDILYSVICSAMSVWSHEGHLLFLDKDRTIKCLNCGKKFKGEKSVPKTRLCNRERFKA